MGNNLIANNLYHPAVDWINGSSMAATINSPIESIQPLTCFAIQSNWTGFTGDAGARITTYGSNDGITFTSVDAVAPTGTTGSYLLNVEKAGYRFVKVIYTQTTTPTGSLFVSISGKAI